MSNSSSAIPTARRKKEGNEEIYERIYGAILEHRLLPGTKLAEERLAEIFKVKRTRIREALSRLAYEQIVDLVPNKGAFIAKPSVQLALDVFEARRVIEPAIMRRLAISVSDKHMARLRAHFAQEMAARERGDKRSVIRLSGEFHNLTAELAGNSALARSLRELTTLTCLIILVYDAPPALSCRADEHLKIIEAIGQGDAATAATLMLQHLDHIQKSVVLAPSIEDVDLAEIFS